MNTISLHNEDCYEVIKSLGDNSVDALVSDPPYDINFMGKGWDKDSLITNVEFWRECLRVIKPGGYLLSFGHSRTSHRTATAIENAGFQIRDTVLWIYGTGFPKSHSLEEGWGSALKPAHEPIIMARKPLCGTIAHNVEVWGTGAINIEACRVGERFPANIIFDEDASHVLDEASGKVAVGHHPKGKTKGFGKFGGGTSVYEGVGRKDNSGGGASKFFYCPKVSVKERNKGLGDEFGSMEAPAKNFHPTVKPVELMKYLIRLVSRESSTILDPFMGSGATGIAANLLGRNFIGCEKEKDYYDIAYARIHNWGEE